MGLETVNSGCFKGNRIDYPTKKLIVIWSMRDEYENSTLDGKYVAFAGTFDGGALSLKDLVYAAGGAPTDN